MEVVIIRLTPYREKDYIVNALSRDGIMTFRAPGALTIKSKFAGQLFLYALVALEVRETKAGLTVTNVETLNSAQHILNSSEKMISLNLIGEVILKTLKDDDSVKDAFLLVKNTLIALGKTNNVHSLIFLFLTNLLRILGLGLVIDRCVISGKQTGIIGVDLYYGGLISEGAQKPTTTLLNEHEIKVLRYGFMIREDQLMRHEFTKSEVYKLTKLMITYLETTYNFKIVANELI